VCNRYTLCVYALTVGFNGFYMTEAAEYTKARLVFALVKLRNSLSCFDTR